MTVLVYTYTTSGIFLGWKIATNLAKIAAKSIFSSDTYVSVSRDNKHLWMKNKSILNRMLLISNNLVLEIEKKD